MGKILRTSLTIAALSVVLFLGGSSFAQAAGAKNGGACTIDTDCITGLMCSPQKKCVAKSADCPGTGIDEAATDAKNANSMDPGSLNVVCNKGPDGATVDKSLTGDRSTMTTGNTDAGGNRTTTTDKGDRKCAWTTIDQCFLDLPGILLTGIGYLLLTLSSLLLGIAGVVFNWVIIRTVFQFALYFGTSTGMLVAWGVLRDIANIALLFGFIFMGIATILNTQGMEGYTAKRALPRLIIFAVLLNFSLFATQAIIDVSNGFSSVFASYASEQCVKTTSSVGVNGQSNEDCANIGISGKIIGAAGISSVFPSHFSDTFDKPYTYAVMLIILSLLVTIAAMVLFAAAIMLVIRVIVLSLLMVTSPIGFAGMAIPALQPIAKDWWHKLINQSFFAPIYLLMIFISLKLVDNLQTENTSIADALMGNTASAGNALTTATTTAGNMQVIVVFIIVIGFMVAALMIAQKMGAYGAGFATKTAAGLTFGAHGFVARRTIGRASGKIAENIRKSDFGHTEAGRFMAGFADKGAKASFDVRGNKVAAKVGGVSFGSAQKGGYDAIVHHGQEAREKYAKTLRQTDADKKEEKLLNDRKKDLGKKKTASSETLDGQKKTLQKEITEQEVTNRAAATKRADERKIQEAKLGAALARGETALAATEEEALKKMTEEHRNQVSKEESGIKEIREKFDEAETAHKDRVNKINSDIEAIDSRIKGDASDDHNIIVGVGSNSASFRYAKDLHDTSKSVVNLATAGGVANHHAASSIIKNAGKSKVEKALADIKEATESSSSHDDHPAEESHAAAAHTAPSGGDHGPKH